MFSDNSKPFKGSNNRDMFRKVTLSEPLGFTRKYHHFGFEKLRYKLVNALTTLKFKRYPMLAVFSSRADPEQLKSSLELFRV